MREIDTNNQLTFFVNFWQGSKVKISRVQFRNIRGTTVSKVAVTLNCSERFPCKGIELADIDLSLGESTSHFDHLSSQCVNVVNPIFTGKQNPPPCI